MKLYFAAESGVRMLASTVVVLIAYGFDGSDFRRRGFRQDRLSTNEAT